MSEDKHTTGSADHGRINVIEGYELRYWTDALDVSAAALCAAVAAVGTTTSAVRAQLNT